MTDVLDLLGRLTAGRGAPVTHIRRLPARSGERVEWPDWVPDEVRKAYAGVGIDAPWRHQVTVAERVHAGRSTVVATGTASGKSLAYQVPVLTALVDSRATALYLAPTKALAADQFRALRALLPELPVATYDGDTRTEERDWARRHARLLLTNPDMLHHSLLRGHRRWASFLRRLRYVVVDECHTYRGVFGSHVAQVLRRLRRLAAHHGADEPVFVLASATVADPASSASRLTGVPVEAVSEDASPRAARTVALWEPPLLPVEAAVGEHGAPVRVSALRQAADLLADLTACGVRTLAFVRSRRGAELVAAMARRSLAEAVDSPDFAPDPGTDDGAGQAPGSVETGRTPRPGEAERTPGLAEIAATPGLAEAGRTPGLVEAGRIAAYRAGYLPEERRELERRLRSGSLLGLAATNALELGVDVAGLDAVLLAGYPGTLASLWQQAGRAGRDASAEALCVLIGRDDPLDTYLLHHPEAIFDRPVERTVLDPTNPYVLAPHLCCAATELPLTEADLTLFGDAAVATVDALVDARSLRRRATGWYWTDSRPPDVTLRGSGGEPVCVVESGTGRLLGTVDAGAAHSQVHAGAVYLHQGASFVIDELDLTDSTALAHAEEPPYTTHARETTELTVVASNRLVPAGSVHLHFGVVDVTHQVVSYQRRRTPGGEFMDERPLDLPPRQLRTSAVWYTIESRTLADAGLVEADLPGALHAAEHAAIGLLPLTATCDRWDIGGLSTALHPDTGLPTIFVYDGHPGGAGFAERGFGAAREWLAATRDAIAACGCDTGCPSCVQSPKCGNGNDPLDKAGALRVLDVVLAALPTEATQ